MNSDFCVAVHALVYLNHKKEVLSSEALAENICTNAARVRKVMSRLKKAGLIETKEGKDGGYSFDLEAKKVSLYRVAKAIDTSFVSTNWLSGDHDKECLVSSGMAGIMDGIIGELNVQCAKYLENRTIDDIDRQIFKEEK